MEENINKEEMTEEIIDTVPEVQPVKKKNRKNLVKNIVIASLSVVATADAAGSASIADFTGTAESGPVITVGLFVLPASGSAISPLTFTS